MHNKPHSMAAGHFKTHCLKIIDEIKKKHQPLIITKHGKPMVKLIPIQEEPSFSLFGCLQDSVVIKSDIVAETGEQWDVEK